MNQIYYIFILFSILFLIEKRAINILISFVGLIISVAIMLPSIQSLEKIDGEYYSYILILVQVSALTILFGFIIMLFPHLSHTTPTNILNRYNNINKYIKISIILLALFILLIYITTNNYNYNLVEILNNNLRSRLISFNLLNNKLDLIKENYKIGIINNIQTDTSFIRKIGESLYSFDNSIMKLIILTIILLLAIISLFFIISL